MSTEDQAYWDKHIKQFNESGLNYKTYCRQEGVHYKRFIYRINKNRKPSANSLIPISLKPQSRPSSALCSIELKSGNRMHIYELSILDKVLGSLS